MKTEKVHQDLIGKPYSAIIDRLEIREDQGDCCGYASCDGAFIALSLDGKDLAEASW